MGEISMIFPVLIIFTLFKHLIIILKCNIFQGFILHPITDTDSMQGHAAQIFKVENVFNNAYKNKYPLPRTGLMWKLKFRIVLVVNKGYCK